MVITVSQHGPDRDISREVKKTEELLADLKRFTQKQFPTQEELEEAPLIDEYVIVPRSAHALSGLVHEHPRLGTTSIMTTQLWVIAPSLGWARTWSRFYRLGFPAGTPPLRS